jgi:hypothetical protein
VLHFWHTYCFAIFVIVFHLIFYRGCTMKSFKFLGLVGLAAASLLTTQAFATACPTAPATGTQTQGSPACVAAVGQDGANTGLASVLGPTGTTGSIFSAGPGVNPYTQQAQKPFWSVGGSSGSISTILLQIAGYKGHDEFGIFDPNNTNNKLALISNGSNGTQASLTVHTNGGYAVNYGFGGTATFSTTNHFGFYLITPGGTFYSLPSANEAGGNAYPNGTPHMVAFEGNGSTIAAANGLAGGVWGTNEWILAWEDQPFSKSDLDYNDFVVLVESVHPVPEPGVLGMFGLGALLIGFGVSRRRRQSV